MANATKTYIKSIFPEPQREDFYKFLRRIAQRRGPAFSRKVRNGRGQIRSVKHTRKETLRAFR